jgi:hypothetical protein
VEAISRRDGLYFITLNKIIRVNLPDDLDPELDHPDAPTTQTLIVARGSRSPIIARTILQARDFTHLHADPKIKAGIEDVAWEVMQSLLAFKRIVDSLDKSIETTTKEIEPEFEKYISGTSPPPLPMIDGIESDFRSAVLTANQSLNAVSELFRLLFANDFGNFRPGRFDTIISWSRRTFGSEDLLTKTLEGDHRWINLWREVRNALEHPRDDYFVKINNFRLLANREIQLPTWQLKHPSLDVYRPQNMIEGLRIHQNNILGFFENLLLLLTDKSIQLPFPLEVIDGDEKGRDPNCPKRYQIRAVSN